MGQKSQTLSGVRGEGMGKNKRTLFLKKLGNKKGRLLM